MAQGVDRDVASDREQGETDKEDEEKRPVVVEVRLGQEEVVRHEPGDVPGGHPGEPAERHQHCRARGPPEEGDVEPRGKHRVPGGERGHEGVAGGDAIERGGQEGLEMGDDQRSGGDPQRDERPHRPDRVEPGRHRRVSVVRTVVNGP